MNNNPLDLILFLGSGITFESNLPKIGDITNSIIHDSWNIEEAKSLFSRNICYPSTFNYVSEIQPFLKYLKSFTDEYFISRKGKQSNYEDLFYLLDQLIDEQTGSYNNPILKCFIEKIQNDYLSIINIPFDYHLRFFIDIQEFIRYVIYDRLNHDFIPQKMDLIKKLSFEEHIQKIDIFTLNHDLLIEELLGGINQGQKVIFSDGFALLDKEIRFFDSNIYDDNQKVRLFKLHGSINWFLFNNVNNNIMPQVGIPGEYLKGKKYYRSSEKNSWEIKYPLFLVGTNNKIIDYEIGIHRELDIKLYQSLKKHDLMVMSGYGWNDIGINNRIVDWIKSSNKKRIFLLYEDPENEIKNKSNFMELFYDIFLKRGQLVTIGKWLKDVTIEELLKEINKNL
ncbi:MAG: SIR2 family protein [bacterium]|nr:SIR2 family protein [bacterium]